MLKTELSYRNVLYIAFLLTYTCVLFLPAMHERYGYIYEILGIMVLVENRKTIPLMIFMNIISLAAYGRFLLGKSINIDVLAVGNLVVYVCYACILMTQMQREKP